MTLRKQRLDPHPVARPMTPPNTPPYRVPPRFVPTLTEVVQVDPPPEVAHAPSGGTLDQPASDDLVLSPRLRDDIVHRVMQRVDATLARDLKAAVAELVVAHTQSLEPLLREEIERSVRRSVELAVSAELRDSAP